MSDDAMLIRPTQLIDQPPVLSSSTLVPDILNRGSSQVKEGFFLSL